MRNQWDWGWSLIPIGINWNVIIECKALNLLLWVTFPNMQWKSMAQLGPCASLPGLCLKKWTMSMEKHVPPWNLCRFLWLLVEKDAVLKCDLLWPQCRKLLGVVLWSTCMWQNIWQPSWMAMMHLLEQLPSAHLLWRRPFWLGGWWMIKLWVRSWLDCR